MTIESPSLFFLREAIKGIDWQCLGKWWVYNSSRKKYVLHLAYDKTQNTQPPQSQFVELGANPLNVIDWQCLGKWWVYISSRVLHLAYDKTQNTQSQFVELGANPVKRRRLQSGLGFFFRARCVWCGFEELAFGWQFDVFALRAGLLFGVFGTSLRDTKLGLSSCRVTLDCRVI